MIRVSQIENLYHTVSHFEPEYSKGTPTLSIIASDYSDLGKEEYTLSHFNKVNILVEELFGIFNEIVIPYFDYF